MMEAETAVSSGSQEPGGLLRVNAPVSFGVLHLAPRWSAFLVQHPKIELDISLNDRQVDLVEEGYDVAVRIARMESSSLVGRRIASPRMRLCASPAYIAQRPPLHEPQDLSDHRVVAYSNIADADLAAHLENFWLHGGMLRSAAPETLSTTTLLVPPHLGGLMEGRCKAWPLDLDPIGYLQHDLYPGRLFVPALPAFTKPNSLLATGSWRSRWTSKS